MQGLLKPAFKSLACILSGVYKTLLHTGLASELVKYLIDFKIENLCMGGGIILCILLSNKIFHYIVTSTGKNKDIIRANKNKPN